MNGAGNPSFNMNARKPKSVMCYICGRDYGTLSITIHVKNC